MKTKTAIYAFSGDPITYGHIDIIERVSNTFDKIVVAIGVNPDKKYLFDLEERTEMARRSLSNIPNVEVISVEGLLVEYAYENDIPLIIKSVRNTADSDYENTLHQVGESQKLGIDTYILFAKPELAHISSSTVKAIQKEQGLVHEYVPLYVKQCLEAKMSGQYIIGITGEIGAGKSYISKRFKEIGDEKEIPVHNIELDHIGHQILSELKEPRYEKIRKEIVDTFGEDVGLSDGTINRKVLGEIVFGNYEALDKLNELMYTPLILRTRKELRKKKGLILLDAALIIESDMAYLCNNNVVLVYADTDSQKKRLLQKNLSQEQINRRLESQYNYEEKRGKLEEIISRDKQGRIWTIDNSDDAKGDKEINRIFQEVVDELGIK